MDSPISGSRSADPGCPSACGTLTSLPEGSNLYLFSCSRHFGRDCTLTIGFGPRGPDTPHEVSFQCGGALVSVISALLSDVSSAALRSLFCVVPSNIFVIISDEAENKLIKVAQSGAAQACDPSPGTTQTQPIEINLPFKNVLRKRT